MRSKTQVKNASDIRRERERQYFYESVALKWFNKSSRLLPFNLSNPVIFNFSAGSQMQPSLRVRAYSDWHKPLSKWSSWQLESSVLKHLQVIRSDIQNRFKKRRKCISRQHSNCVQKSAQIPAVNWCPVTLFQCLWNIKPPLRCRGRG